MALHRSTIQQEIKELREKRVKIDREIQALETYLGVPKEAGKSGAMNGAASIRDADDIRPAVKAIFQENQNQPLSPKEIADAVALKHPGMDKEVIKRKMVHVIRTILQSSGYAKYQLRDLSG